MASVESVEKELVQLVVLKRRTLKGHARGVRPSVQHLQARQQVAILRQHCAHVVGYAGLWVREVIPVSAVLQVRRKQDVVK